MKLSFSLKLNSYLLLNSLKLLDAQRYTGGLAVEILLSRWLGSEAGRSGNGRPYEVNVRQLTFIGSVPPTLTCNLQHATSPAGGSLPALELGSAKH